MLQTQLIEFFVMHKQGRLTSLLCTKIVSMTPECWQSLEPKSSLHESCPLIYSLTDLVKCLCNTSCNSYQIFWIKWHENILFPTSISVYTFLGFLSSSMLFNSHHKISFKNFSKLLRTLILKEPNIHVFIINNNYFIRDYYTI